MKLAWWVAAALAAAGCSVPDKFLSETDGGDDMIDGGDDQPDGAVDTTPPETTITDAPPSDSPDGLAQFVFEANEDATFLCSIDDETPDDCESPYSRALTDGSHSFSVRAVDAAGNQDETPAEHLWNIDTNDPETTITVAPAVVDNSTMASFEFTSDEDNVTFECSEDGGAYAPCPSPHVVGPLTDGSYQFGVRAIDPAGNVDTTPDTHAWTVDTSTPDTTILTGPTGSVASTSASFTFNSPDAGAGATFECSLDAASFTTCTSGIGYTSLPETPHTFQVRVRDSGGNVDPSPATRTWTVDITPPTTSLTSPPSGAQNMTSFNLAFTSNEAGTFQCALDGAAFATCTSPHPVTGLSQGAHSFAVRAVDLAGNQDATPDSASWTVDTVAPDTTIQSGPTSPTRDGSATFTLSSNEAGVTYQAALDAGAFANVTNPFTISAAEGMHTERARAIDAAGNVDTTPATYTWTIDQTGPTITISTGPPQGGTIGSYATFAFSANETATFTCSADGGTAAACPGAYDNNFAEGGHALTIVATDTAGNTGQLVRNWNVVCAAPGSGPGALAHFSFTDGWLANTAFNSVSGFGNGNWGDSATKDNFDPRPGVRGRWTSGYRFPSAGNGPRTYVSWGTTAAPTNAFAVELWFQDEAPTGTTGIRGLFASGDSRVRIEYEILVGGQLNVLYSFNRGDGQTQTASSAAVALGAWHHVVATHNGTVMSLWVDGVETTQNHPVTTPVSFSGAYIGAQPNTGWQFQGLIDEVDISNQHWAPSTVKGRYCPVSAAPATCPATYTTIAGSTKKYKNVTTAQTWQNAWLECWDDLPGWTYLTILENNAELTAQNTAFGGNRWLGIQDEYVNNSWETVLGYGASFLPWEAGQPDGGANQSYVYISGAGTFRDDSTGNPHLYTCECDGQ